MRSSGSEARPQVEPSSVDSETKVTGDELPSDEERLHGDFEIGFICLFCGQAPGAESTT